MTDDQFSYADDEELVGQFLDWTGNALVEMREIVDAMPERDIANGETATRLYDLSHNIKGMGSSFDFQLMTAVGTSLCVYVKKLEGEMSRRVIDAHIRAFEVILANKIKGDGGEKGAALEARLAGIIAEEA